MTGARGDTRIWGFKSPCSHPLPLGTGLLVTPVPFLLTNLSPPAHRPFFSSESRHSYLPEFAPSRVLRIRSTDIGARKFGGGLLDNPAVLRRGAPILARP